ncbi:hypothetical protein DPMN_036325 [Dreissena polymorpha]|uniref:Uncharacterized protein n=1 Tax=Dreissena polymorpha TaxID=45954 RepID=A0A9D4MCC2_DREPO|nr:hypothetical protein DPMN_036325 [Dreissena polymorpha]
MTKHPQLKSKTTIYNNNNNLHKESYQLVYCLSINALKVHSTLKKGSKVALFISKLFHIAS